jgi:predicted secreted protein
MKAKLVTCLVMIGLLISVAACSSVQAAPNSVPKYTPPPTAIQKVAQQTVEATIDEFTQNRNLSRTIEINKGDSLSLVLGANPTTGFSWQEQAQVSDKAVLEQTEHNYIEPVGKDGQAPVMGAPGKDVWVFKSLKTGASEVSLNYSRPWEGGEKGEWAFKLTVVVK